MWADKANIGHCLIIPKAKTDRKALLRFVHENANIVQHGGLEIAFETEGVSSRVL